MIHPKGRHHVLHRETARVILRNRSGQFLLLLTHFEARTGLEPRWIAPGGGIDDGETPLEAAVRELREETGHVVVAEDLGDLIDAIAGYWDWSDGNNFHSYVDHFFALHVDDDFEIDTAGWTESERHDVLELRWWTLEELRHEKPFIGPPRLLELLENLP